MNHRKQTILTVYFSGSGHPISAMLAGFLFKNTISTQHHFAMGFDGCGITHGGLGILFGRGLEEQCLAVREKVDVIVKEGGSVILNCYGHSRGAIAALMVAKMLGNYQKSLVTVNLALLDPVPGNYLTTFALDILGLTLASQSIDLSHCRNIGKILALYPNLPLIAILAHAPLFPRYPAGCQIEQDVIPGCHSSAQFIYFLASYLITMNSHTFISFVRTRDFLISCGTQFDFSFYRMRHLLDYSKEERLDIDFTTDLKVIYKQTIIDDFAIPTEVQIRQSHSYQKIVIKTIPINKYLNLQDKSLHGIPVNWDPNAAKTESVDCLLQIDMQPNQKYSATKKSDISASELYSLYIDFLNEVRRGMSRKSANSLKGECLKDMIAQLTDSASLNNELRNLLKLALQRDRNPYSIFSTTTSGKNILKLFNSQKYAPLASNLLNNSSIKLRYRDLRIFTEGVNDKSHFYAKHRERTYEEIKNFYRL